MAAQFVEGIKKVVEIVIKSETTRQIVKEVAKFGAKKVAEEEFKDDSDLQDLKSMIDAAVTIDSIANRIKELPNKKESSSEETSKDSSEGSEKNDTDDNSREGENKTESTNESQEEKDSSNDSNENTEDEDNEENCEEKRKDSDDLSQKIEQQNNEIKAVESGDKKIETSQEKGNYGEMKMDQDMREKGYERISKDMVTSIDDRGHQGIDGIYYNPNGNPQYIIADAKYGSAQLIDTQDGKQMSDSWVDKRLDESVGKDKADDIRMEALLNPDNVGKYIVRVDSDGNVSYDKIDSEANIVERDVKVNA